MLIFDEERPSDSPFVEQIWRCHSEGADPFLSIAESRCELVVTQSTARQIERARYATLLLRQDISIPDTTHEAGYFDQPHLTRSLKYFIGQTPAQIIRPIDPKYSPATTPQTCRYTCRMCHPTELSPVAFLRYRQPKAFHNSLSAQFRCRH
jgi:AraC-like DNA-binding protein